MAGTSTWPKPWLEPSPSSGSPTDITGCTGYTAQTTAYFLWEGALFGWTSSRCQPSPCPLNVRPRLHNCTNNRKTVSSGCGWSGRCQYTPSFGKRYGTPRHNAMTTRMYKFWRCDEVWESKYLTANHSKPRRFRSQQWLVQGRRSNSALPTWYRDQRRFYCRIRILCCRTATSGEEVEYTEYTCHVLRLQHFARWQMSWQNFSVESTWQLWQICLTLECHGWWLQDCVDVLLQAGRLSCAGRFAPPQTKAASETRVRETHSRSTFGLQNFAQLV